MRATAEFVHLGSMVAHHILAVMLQLGGVVHAAPAPRTNRTEQENSIVILITDNLTDVCENYFLLTCIIT